MERIFKQLKEYAVKGREHSEFINDFVTVCFVNMNSFFCFSLSSW